MQCLSKAGSKHACGSLANGVCRSQQPLLRRYRRQLTADLSSVYISEGRSCTDLARDVRDCRQHAATAEVGSVPNDEGKHFWRVVVPTAIVLLLCNMDRICMSVAVMPMAKEFGWSPSVQGLIQSAFLWGYMATQVLGGRLADQYGGKTVISGAIVFFSLSSLALPIIVKDVSVSATLACVLAVRFAVGVGEGVVLPSMNSLVATQVPQAMKARALGSIFSGFHFGNLVGLALSPLIIINYGWQALFLIFGGLGAPLLLLWLLVAPAQRARTTGASGAQAAQTKQLSPLEFLKFKATWGIVFANFVNHWGYFIYLSWIPSYFANVFGLDLRASSFMAFVPWIAMAVGSSLAGLLADSLVQRFPVVQVRKVVQSVAFLGSAVALTLLTLPGITPNMAMGIFVAALGVTSLGQAGFVANISDIAPSHAGQLFGVCNTFGSFAGIIGVSAAGFLFEATGTFNVLFRLTAGLYVLGAVAFCSLCSADPVCER